MKYIDEFRNKEASKYIGSEIKKIAGNREITLMEVCGTHTMSIYRYGIKKMLPENIRLLSGPGCPVCVTDDSYIDKAIELSSKKDLILTTFGDMIAAVIGQKYGHVIIFKKKTLVGAMSELTINLIIGFIVLVTYTNIYTILAMAFVATIVESLVETLDDNLMVPLFTGFIGQLLLMS